MTKTVSDRRPGAASALPPASDEAARVELVGISPAWTMVVTVVRTACRVDAPVLVTGESGTGKEMVARALHYWGRRAAGPFIPINCGAIPESLQESELFGYVRGAFTGAVRDKPGLFEEADGGTLFLDEVAELSPSSQVKLLRFLQDGGYRPVGGVEGRRADVRVVAATHRDLETAVEDGAFRRDLLYRLNVIPIALPPLRERPADVPVLAEHLLGKHARARGLPPVRLSRRALSLLCRYEWPGNVRELENVLERALAFDRDGTISSNDLPPRLRGALEDRLVSRAVRRGMTLEELEREYILAVLEDCGGIRKEAARRLGITPVTLWRKLRKTLPS